MFKAKIYIILKPSVLDPQGNAVMHALHSLGHEEVADVRVSKYIEVMFNISDEKIVSEKVELICDKVLANPNTETYNYELEPVSDAEANKN